MSTAKLYTFKVCPFCQKAKNLLNQKGIDFEEIDISGNDQKLEELEKETGMSTVPQIWIKNTFVGGCDDLYKLESEGKLDTLINI